MTTSLKDHEIAEKSRRCTKELLARKRDRLGPRMRCSGCGHVASRWTVETDPAYRVETLHGIHHLMTGDCEPDEHATCCPQCEQRDTFEEIP